MLDMPLTTNHLLQLLTVACLLIACTADRLPGPLLDEVPDCPTAPPSFQNDLLPIFELHCNTPVCHAGPFPQARVSLTAFEGVAQAVQGGRLLGSLKRLPGFNPMPVDAPQLDDCAIGQIEAWIAAGAKNN